MLHDELHLSGGENPGAGSESAAEQCFAEGLTAVDPVLYCFPSVVFVALRGVEKSQLSFAVTAYLESFNVLVVSNALCVFCLYHLLCVVIIIV